MQVLRDVLDQLGSGILGVGLGGAAAHVFRRSQRWWNRHGQRALLNGIVGASTEPIFVLPPRTGPPEAILPHISTEDFMAVNNLISAFLMVGWNGKIRVCTSDQLSDHERANNHLILICSSKTNPMTAEALQLIQRQFSSDPKHGIQIPRFVQDLERPSEWMIQVGENEIHRSRSFAEIDALRGMCPRKRRDAELHDVAMILKGSNPWSTRNHGILIVAGIRGFGTWGAAEHLKKWWKDLYLAKNSDSAVGTSKSGGFVALLDVMLSNLDIKEARIKYLVDLDRRA